MSFCSTVIKPLVRKCQERLGSFIEVVGLARFLFLADFSLTAIGMCWRQYRKIYFFVLHLQTTVQKNIIATIKPKHIWLRNLVNMDCNKVILYKEGT